MVFPVRPAAINRRRVRSITMEIDLAAGTPEQVLKTIVEGINTGKPDTLDLKVARVLQAHDLALVVAQRPLPQPGVCCWPHLTDR